MDLLKKLGIIVLVFASFLLIRTLVKPPEVKTVQTADDLKAYLCESNLWDHWFTASEYSKHGSKSIFLKFYRSKNSVLGFINKYHL